MPQARERVAIAYIIAAIVLVAAFFVLGKDVTTHGEPPALWHWALAVHGQALTLAWIFTNFGWIQAFAPFFIAAIVVAIRVPQWRGRMIYLMCSCLVTWGVTDALQRYFARPRRNDWLWRHEHSFSYPSSHASTSTAFYLLAGVLILTSGLPRTPRVAGFLLLAALWLGICWSRLALGAHYPTDVAGGIMLGAAVALVGAAVVRLAGKTPARV